MVKVLVASDQDPYSRMVHPQKLEVNASRRGAISSLGLALTRKILLTSLATKSNCTPSSTTNFKGIEFEGFKP